MSIILDKSLGPFWVLLGGKVQYWPLPSTLPSSCDPYYLAHCVMQVQTTLKVHTALSTIQYYPAQTSDLYYPSPPCIIYWALPLSSASMNAILQCPLVPPHPTILSLSWCTLFLCVLSDLLFAVLLRHPLHTSQSVHRPLVAPSRCQLREWVTPP